MTKLEVRVSYPFNQYPYFDKVISNAVGRDSDFSGAGFGQRDHGWVCKSEIEQKRIFRVLKKFGLCPTMKLGQS